MKLYDSLVDRLRNQHESIPQIISTSHDRLYVNSQPGKWSIHDNITHLAKYQPVFLERIKLILTIENSFFERYSAEIDPEFEIWRKWETDKLIHQLRSDREKIFDLITSLSDEKLERRGTHKKFGDLNILQWTEFFLLHEAHHIFTIFQLSYSI